MIIFLFCLSAVGLTFAAYKYHHREKGLPKYGAYNIDVSQSSQHQKALMDLGGGKRYDGVYVKTLAHLVTNERTPSIVRVSIHGKTVGYLSAAQAKQFQNFGKLQGICPAVIIGGWQRDREQGEFAVKLDLDLK